jgi:hypothetical protein
MSGLVNNPDASWDMMAHVDLIEFGMSPRIVSLPVVSLARVADAMPDYGQSFQLYTAQLMTGTTWSLAMPSNDQSIDDHGEVTINTHAVGAEGGMMHVLAYATFFARGGVMHKVQFGLTRVDCRALLKLTCWVCTNNSERERARD